MRICTDFKYTYNYILSDTNIVNKYYTRELVLIYRIIFLNIDFLLAEILMI